MIKNLTPSISTRPYLIRALFDWCNDNSFTPYIAVKVDSNVQVPKEFVQNGEIVLNISLDATSGLQLGNEFIDFKARFGGVSRQIVVPVGQVVAIYAKENGQGMAFPAPNPSNNLESSSDADSLQSFSKPMRALTKSAALAEPQSAGLHSVNTKEASKTKDADPLSGLIGVRKTLSPTTSKEQSSDSEPADSTPGSGTGRPKLTRVK
jgi:stringent starvation protein B